MAQNKKPNSKKEKNVEEQLNWKTSLKNLKILIDWTKLEILWMIQVRSNVFVVNIFESVYCLLM